MYDYETERKKEMYKRLLGSLEHNQKEVFENTTEAILNSRGGNRESKRETIDNRKE